MAFSGRVLRDEGALLFDLPHPFGGQFDPETAPLERSYHGDPRRTSTSSETSVSDPEVFDHTVGELHNAAVRGGLSSRGATTARITTRTRCRATDRT